MMHICVSNLTIIGSINGLSPGRRQAIIWTNAGILLIRPLGTHFCDILIEIYTFSLTKIHLKMSSGNGGHFVSASMSWYRNKIGQNTLYIMVGALTRFTWYNDMNNRLYKTLINPSRPSAACMRHDLHPCISSTAPIAHYLQRLFP